MRTLLNCFLFEFPSARARTLWLLMPPPSSAWKVPIVDSDHKSICDRICFRIIQSSTLHVPRSDGSSCEVGIRTIVIGWMHFPLVWEYDNELRISHDIRFPHKFVSSNAFILNAHINPNLRHVWTPERICPTITFNSNAPINRNSRLVLITAQRICCDNEW